MKRAIALAIVLAAISVAVMLGVLREDKGMGARCGEGFASRGARCLPASDGDCPAPLAMTAHGCDAPDVRVLVPAASVAMGASDWEAEGRVAARMVTVASFRIDAFEVTRGRWTTAGEATAATGDSARAASGMTRAEAAGFCEEQGGRLPTEDEWIVAAASAMSPPLRYPWGDTGAVCRRAAWGLATGPCASGADGPDTVGTHLDGDSAMRLHDLAGNVAEWVSGEGGPGIAKGGSWAEALASELRIWARLEVDPGARDPRVGLRCVYRP